jgi:hypothetical protein
MYHIRRERERMALLNRMPLRPGLLWLTLAKSGLDYSVFITKYFFFSFIYPLRCLLVPPGVRVSQVEYYWVLY